MAGGARVRGRPHRDDAVRGVSQHHARMLSPEAGVSFGWDRWTGSDGAIIAMDRFGASAPAPKLFAEFGFTAERIAEIARGVVAGTVRGVVPTPHLHDGHRVGGGAH